MEVSAFIVSAVAAGLDYAHRKTDGYGGALGIVHCDVSPSNVMLSTDGYVKILDFGIARASFSSALERRRLRGKPRYMAPEQTLGEPPTAAADVFALGIIAWEMFTGLPLYRGPNVKAILEAVRTTRPPRIDTLDPRVSREIADAVETALSREPVVSLIDMTQDPWLERIVTNPVAVIEMCLGNFTAAMTSARRSLELCQRYGDRGREGDALTVAGIIQLEVGLYDQAAATFAEALEILSRTQARWSRTDCLIYAGVCDLRRNGNHGMFMIEEALAEARRLGARYLEANALVARAGAQLRRGAFASAVRDAAEGTAVAQQATLVGYAIQGTARQALATSRLGGRLAEAVELANRALQLLDQQRVLEGAEEEIYVACHEVLRANGELERAAIVRERGRLSAKRKLDALIDPAWKIAYAAIPEIELLLS